MPLRGRSWAASARSARTSRPGEGPRERRSSFGVLGLAALAGTWSPPMPAQTSLLMVGVMAHSCGVTRVASQFVTGVCSGTAIPAGARAAVAPGASWLAGQEGHRAWFLREGPAVSEQAFGPRDPAPDRLAGRERPAGQPGGLDS